MKQHNYFVYIVTNKDNTVLYTGVTNNLVRRVWEHRNKIHSNSFTARYNINKLVFCENFQYILDAIAAEKRIKAGSRKKKEALINRQNAEHGTIWLRIGIDLTHEIASPGLRTGVAMTIREHGTIWLRIGIDLTHEIASPGLRTGVAMTIKGARCLMDASRFRLERWRSAQSRSSLRARLQKK